MKKYDLKISDEYQTTMKTMPHEIQCEFFQLSPVVMTETSEGTWVRWEEVEQILKNKRRVKISKIIEEDKEDGTI